MLCKNAWKFVHAKISCYFMFGVIFLHQPCYYVRFLLIFSPMGSLAKKSWNSTNQDDLVPSFRRGGVSILDLVKVKYKTCCPILSLLDESWWPSHSTIEYHWYPPLSTLQSTLTSIYIICNLTWRHIYPLERKKWR